MHNPADSFKLGNGCAIPCLGFGTWQTPEEEAAIAASGLHPDQVDF